MARIRITLESALQQKDISGRELERRTGVHRDTIGKYRHNAVCIISLDILERFCDALGCTFAALITDQPAGTMGVVPAPTGGPPPVSRLQATDSPWTAVLQRVRTASEAEAKQMPTALWEIWFDAQRRSL